MDSIAIAVIKEAFQLSIPKSARVDFLHLLVARKPAIRFPLSEIDARKQLRLWCDQWNYGLAYDGSYACVASNVSLANYVLEVDNRREDHTEELGELLGYPRCCTQFVGAIGEKNIDYLVEEISMWEFLGKFKLIDPSQYSAGHSLICHLPCSPHCEASLEMAAHVLKFLRGYSELPEFSDWRHWIFEYAD
jgi:hypothetical protein